jgi:pteridine reductase
MLFKDQHVLITGAGKRLGKALCDYFSREGARVSGHVYQSTPQDSPKVKYYRADLRQVSQIERLCRAVEQESGPVDTLINSASDFFPTEPCAESDWESLFALNLKAPYYLSSKLQEGLKARKGCILNLVDIHAQKPLPHFAVYCASKGGLWTLTRSLAAEWAPFIRVNSISPGTVLVPESFTEEQVGRATERTLVKRLGTPEDIVQAASFLCRNRYLTGVDLKVDGGASLL